MFKLLLQQGANTNARDDVSAGELLLLGGAGFTARDCDGETALHVVVGYGDIVLMKLLLGWSAGIEAWDNYESKPLHLLAWDEHESVASLSLEQGADIQARNKDGETAVHIASHQYRKLVEILLREKGA